MHRFFTSPENITEDTVTLRGTDVAHIRNVLRLKNGDRVQVLDGCGSCFTVYITHVGREKVEGRIDSRDDADDCESPLFIHLGQALVKGTGYDGIVRRAVELGVGHVAPVKARRCVVKLSRPDAVKKMERWQRIAREAAKQCGRGRVPEVGPALMSVEEFCSANRDVDLRLAFWEEERATRIDDLAVEGKPRSAAILIGPEGGFAAAEIDSAKEYGFQPVTLGPRLLRTATAPLAALAILQHRWGDL
ncbi:MAG: 16S rRNA (uracil(1498)-N(3))-methyltransferase [Nitrospinae bacterium]|nr:16S rRNA (uracil(1498)-N(3))-methyltransferase [Nitrospinota bacterium]